MKGNYNLCENYGKKETGHRHYGHLSQGVYAQYAVFTGKAISKMPDGVSFAEGAIVDTAGTALHVLELTGVPPGGTIAVIGPGPIGLLTGRLAKIMGASRVIIVGRGGRLDIAGRLCADETIDFEKEEPVKAVRALTGGRGVDVAIDCSGAKGTLAEAIRMVKRGGKVGLVGIPPQGHMEGVPYRTLVLDQISVLGSRANPNVSKPVLTLMASGRLSVKDMITHTFPLKDFKTGLDYFLQRREGALKVIIEPN
jgi:L-iditol 2-dehydrogenase